MVLISSGTGSIHSKISGYFSSTQTVGNETGVLRNLLKNKSFEEQYQTGLDVLKQFGVTVK